MIHSETLDCGARVVTERMADARSVTLGVWVGTGSRDEEPSRAGASHFLEHLLFKGTPSWTAGEIAEAVDEVGGDMDAFTTKEYTAFTIRLLSEDLPLGLDVLSAIMTDPAFRPGDVDAERQVILDEILMHSDEPADLVGERYMEGLFPGHPLGREVLGEPGVISSIGPDEIREFFDHHYRAANLVVAAAGQVEHELLAREVASRFAGRSGGSRPTRTPPGPTIDPLVVTTRATEQAHIVLGMRTPGRHDERRFALGVLNHALGGGISSRLFQEVRERRGLAYAVWSERSSYDEVGSLSVSVGTAPENAQEVLRLVVKELDRLGEDGLTRRELEVAKGHWRAETILALEDPGSRMARIGSSMLLHSEVVEVEELLERVMSVSLEEVGTLAAELAAAPRVLSVVGPFEPGDFEDMEYSAVRAAGARG